MKFKKSLVFLLMIMIIMSMIGCKSNKTNDTTTAIASDEKITVAVSIIPQETFVKAVAGDLVEVITLIPPGNSPANYQPTPKQMADFSKTKIYLTIGVSTEEVNILPNINDFNNEIKIVSLANKVRKVYPLLYFEKDEHASENKDHYNSGQDPHIWLSPKRVEVMIETIRDELIEVDPSNKSIYTANADAYLDKLEKLHNYIEDSLSGLENKAFIIYHPSFRYFAEDYGLQMISLEEDGKESTAKRIGEVIDFARDNDIKVIFYQEEFDSKQAETVAKEIGGTTIKVVPLAANYIENLEYIANKFKEILK